MIGMLQGKVWGTTQCIFHDNNVEIHRIEAKAGGYCSKHEHVAKFNLFYMESGRLKVTIFRSPEGEQPRPTDSTILVPGMSSLVRPGEKHMFEALEDSIAYEIYWVKLDPGDIKRYEEGGFREVQ